MASLFSASPVFSTTEVVVADLSIRQLKDRILAIGGTVEDCVERKDLEARFLEEYPVRSPEGEKNGGQDEGQGAGQQESGGDNLEEIRRERAARRSEANRKFMENMAESGVSEGLVGLSDEADKEPLRASARVSNAGRSGSCSSCFKSAVELDLKLMACARCKSAHYCSKECQAKDWGVHKKVCKTLKELRGSSGSAPRQRWEPETCAAFRSFDGATLQLIDAVINMPELCPLGNRMPLMLHFEGPSDTPLEMFGMKKEFANMAAQARQVPRRGRMRRAELLVHALNPVLQAMFTMMEEKLILFRRARNQAPPNGVIFIEICGGGTIEDAATCRKGTKVCAAYLTYDALSWYLHTPPRPGDARPNISENGTPAALLGIVNNPRHDRTVAMPVMIAYKHKAGDGGQFAHSSFFSPRIIKPEDEIFDGLELLFEGEERTGPRTPQVLCIDLAECTMWGADFDQSNFATTVSVDES
jgi:MYND finger